MNTIKCCVIDDEPLAAGLIASYIEKTPGLLLSGSFSSAQEAVKHILGSMTDVVFLDINMPQLNGLEFAKIIPPTVNIIFTTAYDNYALESFRVNALDYLLKPVSYEDFLDAIRKVRFRLDKYPTPAADNHHHLIVKSDYKLIQVDIDSILYIEGVKDYVKIVLDNGDQSIMTLMNIKTLEQSLPVDRFMRVHRSFIVNTDKIKVIERNRIIFGKTYIPVSDTYKQAFADYIASRSLTRINDID